MNRRHRSAQLAGRSSVQLHTLIFFSGDGDREEDAYVLDVDTTSTEPSFSVIVPRYGIEGRVRMEGISPSLLESDEHRLCYHGDTGELSIQVFDKIKVRIWVRELEDHQRELVLNLVSPALPGSKETTKRKPTNASEEASGSKKRKVEG